MSMTATKYISAFYQIIKDPTGTFPICRPYGTSGNDKGYDFGTAFWDGTYYKANADNAKGLAGFNRRDKMLRETFSTAEPITNVEWNQLITKLRQEFAIRCEFNGSYVPSVKTVGVTETGDRTKSGSDNHQFFSPKDEILREDYKNIYRDIMSLLVYEIPVEDAVNNPRLPMDNFSFNRKNTAGGYGGDSSNLDVNPNAEAINEGTRVGNNWWTGQKMREYMYRHATGATVNKVITSNANNGILLTMGLPSDILTNKEYGYTTFGSRNVAAYIPGSDMNTTKTVRSSKRPYGNTDYLAKTVDENGTTHILKNSNGFYQVSQEFKDMVAKRKKFLGGNVKVKCTRTVLTGKDEYGMPKYVTEKEEREMPLVTALTSVTVSGNYTVDISADSVGRYYMAMVNQLARTCVCNCNYCSCFGHEASCICYVVKVSGWCYSYQYDFDANRGWISPETVAK